MTVEQTRKILVKIQTLETDIATLEDVRKSLATSEFVSASISSGGGGSKSYTRQDIGKIQQAIIDLRKELIAYRKMLVNGGSDSGLGKTIIRVWA